MIIGCIDPTPDDLNGRATATMDALAAFSSLIIPKSRRPLSDGLSEVRTTEGNRASEQEVLLDGHVQLPVLDECFRALLQQVTELAADQCAGKIASLSAAGWSLQVSLVWRRGRALMR